MEDGEKSGREPILNEAEQEQAIETALKNPKFPHRQLSEIKAETGKKISKYTLKNLWCFDKIAETPERETVVVIDNAPTHTSQEFEDKIEEWEKLG